MARNLMLDAMQGFRFVDKQFRQAERDKERKEDRAYTEAEMGRAAKQRGLESKVRAANVGVIESLFEGQQPDDAKPAPDVDISAVNQEIVNQIFEGEKLSKENPMGYQKALDIANNPELGAGILGVSDEIMEIIDSGKLPPSDMVANYMNIAGSQELNDRAQKQGLAGLQVTKVVPAPSGKGVMVEFEATTKDGQKYNAPMTAGASTDPNDQTVAELSMEQLMGWLGGSREAARKLMIAQAKAGNPVALNKYREFRSANIESKKKLAAEQRKRKEKIEDYRTKKEIDLEFKPDAKGTWKQSEDGTWEFLTPERSGKVKGAKPVGKGSKPDAMAISRAVKFGDSLQEDYIRKGKAIPDDSLISWNELRSAAGLPPVTQKVTKEPTWWGLWEKEKAELQYGETGATDDTTPEPQPEKVSPGTELDEATMRELLEEQREARTSGDKNKYTREDRKKAREKAEGMGYTIPKLPEEPPEERKQSGPKRGEAGAAEIGTGDEVDVKVGEATPGKGLSLSAEDQAVIDSRVGPVPEKYLPTVTDQKAIKAFFRGAKSAAKMTKEQLKGAAAHMINELKTIPPDLKKAFMEQDWPKIRKILLAFERDPKRDKKMPAPQYKAGGRTI